MGTLPAIFLQILDAWFRLSLYSTIGYFLIGVLAFLFHAKFKEIGNLKSTIEEFGITNNLIIIYSLSLLVIPCPFGNQIEAIGYLFLMLIISFGVLGNKALSLTFQFLGRYAYFVYFMHFLVLATIISIAKRLNFTTSATGSQQVIFIFVFSLSIIISTLIAIPSMKIYERPIIRLSHKIE